MIAAWLLASALAAEPASPTLDAVLVSVDRHLPLVVAAEADMAAREARRVGAVGVYDPTLDVKGWWRGGDYDQGVVDATVTQATPLWGLSFQGGWRLGLGKFAPYETKSETGDVGEGWAELTLPLLKDGWTDARRTGLVVADAELDGGEAALATARVLAARDARTAWWRWLAAGERLAVARSMREVAERTRDGIARRVQVGDIPPIDLVDAERIVLERRAREVSAHRDLDAAANRLGLFLRDDAGAATVPRGVVPPLLDRPERPAAEGEDEALRLALESHPELRALRARHRGAEARLRLARNGILPKLDLVAGLERGLDAADDAPLDLRIGGALGFSLMQRPARAKLDESSAEVAGVEARLRWAEDQIAADVRTAWLTVGATFERAGLAQRAAALADELARAERRRHELGDADLLRVYQRERFAMDAAFEAVDAWTAYHVAMAELLAATGRR